MQLLTCLPTRDVRRSQTAAGTDSAQERPLNLRNPLRRMDGTLSEAYPARRKLPRPHAWAGRETRAHDPRACRHDTWWGRSQAFLTTSIDMHVTHDPGRPAPSPRDRALRIADASGHCLSVQRATLDELRRCPHTRSCLHEYGARVRGTRHSSSAFLDGERWTTIGRATQSDSPSSRGGRIPQRPLRERWWP